MILLLFFTNPTHAEPVIGYYIKVSYLSLIILILPLALVYAHLFPDELQAVVVNDGPDLGLVLVAKIGVALLGELIPAFALAFRHVIFDKKVVDAKLGAVFVDQRFTFIGQHRGSCISIYSTKQRPRLVVFSCLNHHNFALDHGLQYLLHMVCKFLGFGPFSIRGGDSMQPETNFDGLVVEEKDSLDMLSIQDCQDLGKHAPETQPYLLSILQANQLLVLVVGELGLVPELGAHGSE